ncbi:hypothetical protein [Sneathiella glossodoripedis]|uniref:hypothetical protein n=1 Tax=Sneathiella glossodoripedis TaxID=418853 RepID=UPI0011DE12CD|nr:hypothetical protein [Sneathiella glossodoripedis]
MKSVLKLIAALSIPLLAGACSTDFGTDIFSMEERVLPCPTVSILPGAETITVFREGPGRDLVDVTFEGSIEPLKGECLYEDDDSLIVAELFLQLNVVKGPASNSNSVKLPFFISIVDRDKKILSKRVFDSPIEIPEGKRRGAALEEMIHRIPVLSGRDGRDYTIVLGFQLTAEQLEYNRQNN